MVGDPVGGAEGGGPDRGGEVGLERAQPLPVDELGRDAVSALLVGLAAHGREVLRPLDQLEVPGLLEAGGCLDLVGKLRPAFVGPSREGQFAAIACIGADPALAEPAGRAARDRLGLEDDDLPPPPGELPGHAGAVDPGADDDVVERGH